MDKEKLESGIRRPDKQKIMPGHVFEFKKFTKVLLGKQVTDESIAY